MIYVPKCTAPTASLLEITAWSKAPRAAAGQQGWPVRWEAPATAAWSGSLSRLKKTLFVKYFQKQKHQEKVVLKKSTIYNHWMIRQCCWIGRVDFEFVDIKWYQFNIYNIVNVFVDTVCVILRSSGLAKWFCWSATQSSRVQLTVCLCFSNSTKTPHLLVNIGEQLCSKTCWKKLTCATWIIDHKTRRSQSQLPQCWKSNAQSQTIPWA